MFTVYVTLSCLTAVAAATAAWMDFVRHPIPVAASKQVQVPESWMLPLGILLGAGALGLVGGFVVPSVGIAAATGLVLYFVGAIIAHLRVRDYQLGMAATAFALIAATLAATLAYRFG